MRETTAKTICVLYVFSQWWNSFKQSQYRLQKLLFHFRFWKRGIFNKKDVTTILAIIFIPCILCANHYLFWKTAWNVFLVGVLFPLWLFTYVLVLDVLNIKGAKKGGGLNLPRCAEQEGVLQLCWDEQVLHTTRAAQILRDGCSALPATGKEQGKHAKGKK